MEEFTAIIHNGKTVSGKEELNTNRGFLYGDGFFESMRYENDKLFFEEDHWERLNESIQLLQIDPTNLPSRNELYNQINQLITINNYEQPLKIRLSVYRKAEGNYTPENNGCGYMLQVFPISNYYGIPEKGLRAGIYNQQAKAAGKYSSLKTLSSQLNVMAGIYMHENNWDEALLINSQGNFIEGVSSNLFIILNDVLLTPPLSEGCVNGVFRKQVLKVAKEAGFDLAEKVISQKEIDNASEIWFTNLIRGIQWTEELNGNPYGKTKAELLMKYFIENLNKS